MNSHPSLSSPHSDVLTHVPDSPASRERLVEELKSRGKACVLSKSWPDADALYARAIELLEHDGDEANAEASAKAKANAQSKEADLAILYSNRSLAAFNMAKLSESRELATTATSLDRTYVKAYWRLGQACAAMEDWSDALDAYEKAVKVDAESGGGKMAKALGKEVGKCQVKVEQERLLVMEGKFDGADISNGSSTSTSEIKSARGVEKKAAATSSGAKAKSSPAKAKAKAKADAVKDTDAGDFTKSDHVKGYKIVNGKKTSFFHHEMTEEEKKLIGDIAPKKLDANAAAATATSAEPVVEGASAWNKAGTWEEKDITKWSIDTLSSTLLTCSYDIPSTDQTVKVVKANKMAVHDGGHASVAAVRGKKRYIYEFGYELVWELSSAGGDADVEMRGKLTLPDIDGTVAAGEWHDVSDFSVDGGIPNAKRAYLIKHVRDGGLREVIETKIDGWVTLLKATY
jgi:tetratricopeptide (TPR) repeat protein